MTPVAWNKLPAKPCAPFYSKSRLPSLIYAAVFAVALPFPVHAAGPPQDPLPLLKLAVQAELHADDTDLSRWRYRDEQQELSNVSIVVQTDNGSVKRLIAHGGQPLTPSEAREEDERIDHLIHDPSRRAREKKDAEQDDRNARDLLTMLPEAFLWRLENEDASTAKLHFEPKPDFHPPNLQSKVLAAMNGTVIINKAQHRIQTISGRLTEDVIFGYGFLGRLRQGGTFRVERRELAPGLWQITETHVHIDGKALLFKNIGQQQDEIQTNYTPVPHGTTLEQAAAMSRP